jgi:hypothetical protein
MADIALGQSINGSSTSTDSKFDSSAVVFDRYTVPIQLRSNLYEMESVYAIEFAADKLYALDRITTGDKRSILLV